MQVTVKVNKSMKVEPELFLVAIFNKNKNQFVKKYKMENMEGFKEYFAYSGDKNLIEKIKALDDFYMLEPKDNISSKRVFASLGLR